MVSVADPGSRRIVRKLSTNIFYFSSDICLFLNEYIFCKKKPKIRILKKYVFRLDRGKNASEIKMDRMLKIKKNS